MSRDIEYQSNDPDAPLYNPKFSNGRRSSMKDRVAFGLDEEVCREEVDGFVLLEGFDAQLNLLAYTPFFEELLRDKFGKSVSLKHFVRSEDYDSLEVMQEVVDAYEWDACDGSCPHGLHPDSLARPNCEAEFEALRQFIQLANEDGDEPVLIV